MWIVTDMSVSIYGCISVGVDASVALFLCLVYIDMCG